MSVMTAAKAPPDMRPDVWPHEDRPLTVKDMENMPDDGNRYELDEGMLIVSPRRSTTIRSFRPAQLLIPDPLG
jgi:hypothetical protein